MTALPCWDNEEGLSATQQPVIANSTNSMNIASILGGAGQALASRNYRVYWIGNAASIFGFWVHKLALGVLTWELTSSPLWLGLIGFGALFPSFILSPFAGALADRFGMRKIASFALIISGLGAGLLGFAVLLDIHTIELILVLTILQGIGLAFDLPARQGLVPILIDRSVLSSAIALNTTTFHLGATLGPGLFALLILYANIEWAFLLNGLTFFLFAYCLWALDLPPRPVKDLTGTTILSDMRDGIVYTATHPGIQALFVLAIFPHFLLRPFVDLLPGFSDVIFNRGADGVAVLAASFGSGSLICGLWLARRGRTHGLARISVFAICMGGLFMFGFAVTSLFWFAAFCLFMVGVCIIAFAVANQSLVQNSVDPAKRARVISLSTGMAVGLPATGALILGGLSENFGLQAPLAGAMVCGLIFWSWSSRRVLRHAKDLEADI